MSEGEEGILGRLPRERPGVRSGKRANRPAATRRKRATAASGAGRRPAAPTPPRQASAPKERTAAPQAAARREPAPVAADGADPLGDAARLAGQAAGVGLRIAARLAGEAFRRLPRP